MPRTSTPITLKTSPERESLRKRVGAFVRKRREHLELSQGDIIRELGYVSRNSVSNIETGREGLPAKRIYAWAEVLKVPHDAFFRFATGDSKRMDMREEAGVGPLNANETELVQFFRALSVKNQKQLRAYAKELRGGK